MSKLKRERPGFHAIMSAAAFAEEGLHDAALQILRGEAGTEEVARPEAATPRERWLGEPARRQPVRTA